MEALELTRIVGAEVDDQAIAEVRALLPDEDLSPAILLRTSAAGPLWVARRPCGSTPEIVGVAALIIGTEGVPRRVAAVDPAYADEEVLVTLQARLTTLAGGPSLFRRHEGALLGLTHAVA